MAALELKNSVWLDRPKYEAAETHYHEVIAKRHSGLRIEVSLKKKKKKKTVTEL